MCPSRRAGLHDGLRTLRGVLGRFVTLRMLRGGQGGTEAAERFSEVVRQQSFHHIGVLGLSAPHWTCHPGDAD